MAALKRHFSFCMIEHVRGRRIRRREGGKGGRGTVGRRGDSGRE